MEDLHDVLFMSILPRLPTKSVLRFKSVSKQWHSFLTSDLFKTLHSRHVDQQKNNLQLLVLHRTKRSFKSTTIDCEELPMRKGLSRLTHRPLPQFRGTPQRSSDIGILASCHGLVCLGIIKEVKRYSDLILWNPLTKEYKRLSKSNSRMELDIWNTFGLYYTSCEDDYKLVSVNLKNYNFYIYSLKPDSWRKVDAFHCNRSLYHEPWSQGTYLNENLYFLQKHPDRLVHSSSVIRFDTKTERLSKIDTPNVDPNSNYYDATIIVVNDCIHVCVKYDSDLLPFMSLTRSACFKLWKLDEHGNMKEMLAYELEPCINGDTFNYLRPFHLMKNGNWLMLKDSWWRNYKYRIYKWDLIKKRQITNKRKEKEEDNLIFDDYECARVKMYNFTNDHHPAGEVRYIETFVSPNRYKK